MEKLAFRLVRTKLEERECVCARRKVRLCLEDLYALGLAWVISSLAAKQRKLKAPRRRYWSCIVVRPVAGLRARCVLATKATWNRIEIEIEIEDTPRILDVSVCQSLLTSSERF